MNSLVLALVARLESALEELDRVAPVWGNDASCPCPNCNFVRAVRALVAEARADDPTRDDPTESPDR